MNAAAQRQRGERRRADATGLAPSACRWVALTISLVGSTGCSTAVVRRSVERRVVARLPEILGPAEHYRVEIRGSRDPELVRGRVKHLEIEGIGIRAREQFDLRRLTLSIDGLRYEGVEPYVVSIEQSRLVIEFTDQALNDYLQARRARYEPRVRFGHDRVEVALTYPFLGKPTPLTAAGHFRIEDGKRLVFVATEAQVPFLPNQPEFQHKFVEERVNPLLDLGRIEFPARLDSIRLSPGLLTAQGSAVVPRPPDS